MRSWLYVFALSAMLILVAACGSDDDATDDAPTDDDVPAEVEPTATPEPEPTETPAPTATPEPEPTETPAPTPEPEPTEAVEPEDDSDSPDQPGTAGELDGYLLSLDDLPQGWTQVEDDFPMDEEVVDGAEDPWDAPCGIEAPDFEPVAEGEREFEGSELGPYLNQSIMQFGSADEAQQALSLLREIFGCDEWTETDDFGDEMTFTITEVPFDGVGEDSFAILLGLTFDDEMPELDMFGELAFDLVIFQRGEFVSMIMYFDLFGMSDTDIESIAQLADGKLQ